MSGYRCLNCRCDLGRRNRGRGYCQTCHQENAQVKQSVKGQGESLIIIENQAQAIQEDIDIQKRYIERQNTDIGEVKAAVHRHDEDMKKMRCEVDSLRLEPGTNLEIAQENRKKEEAKALQEQAKAKQEEAKVKQEEAKAKQEEAKAKQEEAKAKQEEAKAKQEEDKILQLEKANIRKEELRLEQEEIKLKQEEMKVQQEKAKAQQEKMKMQQGKSKENVNKNVNHNLEGSNENMSGSFPDFINPVHDTDPRWTRVHETPKSYTSLF